MNTALQFLNFLALFAGPLGDGIPQCTVVKQVHISACYTFLFFLFSFVSFRVIRTKLYSNAGRSIGLHIRRNDSVTSSVGLQVKRLAGKKVSEILRRLGRKTFLKFKDSYHAAFARGSSHVPQRSATSVGYDVTGTDSSLML